MIVEVNLKSSVEMQKPLIGIEANLKFCVKVVEIAQKSWLPGCTCTRGALIILRNTPKSSCGIQGAKVFGDNRSKVVE